MTVFPVDETHAPELRAWVDSATDHRDFPIQNLPYGVFSRAGEERRIGIAIGTQIVDLTAIAHLLPEAAHAAVRRPDLQGIFALAPADRRDLRRAVSRLLSNEGHRARVEPALHDAKACTMHLPAVIGDYSDFYAGKIHAENAGAMFRPDMPLLPNYMHVPIGYHGRASSICISGSDIVRPSGQRLDALTQLPVFGPTERLDYELELAIWVSNGNRIGTPIPIDQAEDHIFGLALFNDWSARDIQAWEYQPLGPFLAKSFQSSISPWIVTLEALAPFRVAQRARGSSEPKPLPYLLGADDQDGGAFRIELDVHLSTKAMRDEGLAPLRITRADARDLYWTAAQMLTHQTSNGCNVNPGDILGTGTISSPGTGGCGCLLEMTSGGSAPLSLPNKEQRTYLEDGDEIVLTGRAHADNFISIGFGECAGRILARP